MNRISRSHRVIWDDVDGRTLLCHTDGGEFFELSPTGALIWKGCDDTTAERLVDLLHAAYPDHDRETLAGDVTSFLSSMEQEGLLEIEDNSTGVQYEQREASRCL